MGEPPVSKPITKSIRLSNKEVIKFAKELTNWAKASMAHPTKEAMKESSSSLQIL